MKKCSFCGEINPDDTVVCPWCGRREVALFSNRAAGRTSPRTLLLRRPSLIGIVFLLLLAGLLGVAYAYGIGQASTLPSPIPVRIHLVTPTLLPTVTSTPAATRTPFRPASGIIQDELQEHGTGLLEIENGLQYDGVVVVALENARRKPILVAYVWAGTTYTITVIPDGEYFVWVTTGSGWNGQEFGSYALYSHFQDIFTYGRASNMPVLLGAATGWSITLHSVNNGNARTISVGESDFPIIAPDDPAIAP